MRTIRIRTPIEMLEDILNDVTLIGPDKFIEDDRVAEEGQEEYVHPTPLSHQLQALRVLVKNAVDEAPEAAISDADAKLVARAKMLAHIWSMTICTAYGMWGPGEFYNIQGGRIVWVDYDFPAKDPNEISAEEGALWVTEFIGELGNMPPERIKPVFAKIRGGERVLGVLDDVGGDLQARKLVTLVNRYLAQGLRCRADFMEADEEMQFNAAAAFFDRMMTKGKAVEYLLDYYLAARFGY